MSEFDSTKDNEIIETNDDFENDEFVKNKIAFIERYKAASNTANATIDDNSNVFSRNVAIINSEIHKKDNTRISRAMVISKLKELYPNFNAKRYVRDLEDHVIYKHDESSFAGAIAPYTYSSKEVVYVKYNEKPYLIPFDLLYNIVDQDEVLVDKDNIVYQKYPKNLYIYDKDNTWTCISHITKKKRHRDLVRVKTYFGEDLVVTDNHPMIVDVDNTDNTVEAINSLGKKQYKTDTQFEFDNNDSLDLTNIFDCIKVYKDYVLYKDNNVTHLPVSISVDREFGKFIGLFIDKGKFREHSKSIEIEFDTAEDADKWSNYLQDKFNLSCLTYTYNDKVLIATNEFLYDLLKEYFLIGGSIYNRTLPAIVFSFNDKFALGIIEGLLNIDSLDNNSLYYQSPSRSLILQISAILKYFGYAIKNSHNLYDYDNTDISAWNVSAYKLSNVKDTDFYEYRMNGETVISDVYKLNDTDPFVESQNEFIYDITTSTHTFALNNILVHNCVSITMYPFLMDGIKGLGGLSASPKNLKSFCGIFCNMIFAISSQFAGACLYKDQKLLINNNNLSYNVKIKDFVNKFNLTNRFSNYQGDWEYTDISNQDYFVEEDEKKVKINKVYRRKYYDEIYKVKTHSGLECRVSKDHKFKVLYRGRIIEVPAHDLKQYDTVFVSTDHSCMIDKNSQDYRDGQFLGIICGDGSVTNKNYVRIAIHKDQMYIKDFLDSYFMDVYGKIGSCALDPRKNAMCYNYTVSSMSIRNKICDLLTPCERHDTYTKNVDIENKSLDFQMGFLDGLLVTDGNFSLDKSIRISLTNEGLIDTVIKIVKNLNIPCGKKTGGKVYEKQTNKRPVYNFCVPSKVRKYLQLTPLKACKSSIERTSKRKDTNDKLQGKETYYLGPSHAEDAHGNKFICRGNTHNEVYKQYRTDVVESIETFKNDDKYVYEIETETHWYNCGGMITHNCATSEALLYFTYFCKKEWGDDFYKRLDEVVGHSHSGKQKTILSEIQQYWQQIVYTINQPAAARGFQSAFVNFSYFDKPFFEGMFGEFYFPDGTKPDWESLKIMQMEFMKWFNAERLKTILTFPVETVTLLYKDGKFLDEDMYNFVCDEYARGHSFFTYISDTVDSLSSCCFEGDEIIKVYDKNNNAKSISIKEFVNMNDSSINESGCKINNDFHYIDSYNENGDVERVKITGTLKKESSKLYEFTINDKHIAVTGDHIMMVKDTYDNEIKFIPAEFIAKDINRYLLATE